MNNLDHLFAQSTNAQQFVQNYTRYLASLLEQLDADAIATFMQELERARNNQNTIFIAGNGGSAATASHMANDLGALASKFKKEILPFRAHALTDNVALMTAIANDEGYDQLFLEQLKIHYREGDKLILISASGNSPNVLLAAQWVKFQGGTVIGLVGFDGGKMKEFCDILIHIQTPQGEYGPVEDIHMILDHLIMSWFHHRLAE